MVLIIHARVLLKYNIFILYIYKMPVCSSERISLAKGALERLLVEIKNIGKFSNKQVGENLYNIYNTGDFYPCIINLGDAYPNIKTTAYFINGDMRRAIAAFTNGMTQPNKFINKCVPHIENMLRFLNEEYKPNYESDSSESEYESEYESQDESEPNNGIGLFPSHKYLNLNNKSEFPQVKSNYRKLSLIYHPDKCPNDKTSGMDKSQCETEFKILNNEYDAIKEKLNIVGGRKRKTRRILNKQYKNKSRARRTVSKKVKKNKRKNTRKNTRKNNRK